MRNKGGIMKKSSFQFVNPNVQAIEFYENKNFIQENFTGFQIGLSYKIENKTEFSAEVILRLKIGGDDGVPFNVMVQMGATFEWDKTCFENLECFLNKNAVALLVSYIRPVVSNITSFSKYPTLNIPFIDLSDGEICLIED